MKTTTTLATLALTAALLTAPTLALASVTPEPAATPTTAPTATFQPAPHVPRGVRTTNPSPSLPPLPTSARAQTSTAPGPTVTEDDPESHPAQPTYHTTQTVAPVPVEVPATTVPSGCS